MSLISNSLIIRDKVFQANRMLLTLSKPFTPGTPWMIPKRVYWSGITEIRTFSIDDDYVGDGSAFPKGRKLTRSLPSKIKKNKQNYSYPFKIDTQKLPPMMRECCHDRLIRVDSNDSLFQDLNNQNVKAFYINVILFF